MAVSGLMVRHSMIRSIVAGLVWLYCLATVLAPVFVFNKIFFVPLFFIAIYVLMTKPIKYFAPFFVMAIFAYGFALAIMGDADFDLARMMLLGSASLFLIYVIIEFKIDIEMTIKTVGVLFALMMCFFSLSLMVAPDFFMSVMLLDFYSTNELGYYGLRDFGGLQVFMLHHRSSPFLLLPLSLFFLDFLQSRRFISIVSVVVVLFAIVWSASRGLMVMAVASLFILYFFNERWPARLMMLFFIFPVSAFALGYLLGETSIFSLDEKSNNIKVGHLLSFFDIIDWKMLYFGDGLGSYFYTEAYGKFVSQTEITWMDSVRFIGLPLSIVLFVIFFFPQGKVILNSRVSSSRLVFFLYLILSLSNPILFNSFGFLVILWYWSVMIKPLEPSVVLH